MDFVNRLTRNSQIPWATVPLQLMDGSVISIQCGPYHHSEPGTILPDFSGYRSFEVVFLEAKQSFPELGEYETPASSGRQWGIYVPPNVVQRIIDRAGGIRGLYVMDC